MTTGPSDDWRLPPVEGGAIAPPKVYLDKGELLLIDWVLCAAPRLILEGDLEHYLWWNNVRLQVWRHIRAMDSRPLDSKVPFELTNTEAEMLMVLVPTTHRWGVGNDVGYSLKRKLAGLLLGDPDPAPAPAVAGPVPVYQQPYVEDE